MLDGVSDDTVDVHITACCGKKNNHADLPQRGAERRSSFLKPPICRPIRTDHSHPKGIRNRGGQHKSTLPSRKRYVRAIRLRHGYPAASGTLRTGTPRSSTRSIAGTRATRFLCGVSRHSADIEWVFGHHSSSTAVDYGLVHNSWCLITYHKETRKIERYRVRTPTLSVGSHRCGSSYLDACNRNFQRNPGQLRVRSRRPERSAVAVI